MVAERAGWDHLFMLPLAFGCTLALSFALYHGVEQPMRKRVRDLLMRKPTRELTAVGRPEVAEA
jgi:peptidoglycan/LPS O-acetylase OafA/YrhL